MMKCGLLLIFLALFGFVVTQNELRIAGFYPLTGDLAEFGSSSESATRFSVETLNAGYLADRNLTINFQGFDTSSDPGQGLQSLNSARESFNMFGVLGSQDDLTSSTIALSSTLFFYPQISYGSRGNFLTSSSDFPFFARVIPSFESEGTGLAALLNIYGWKNVGVIFTADDYGILTSERFINDLNDDITVTSVQFTPGETSLAPQMTVLRESLTRVNVMLPSSIEDARTILRESYRYEIVGDQFIWFGGSFAASSEIYVDNDREDDTNYFLKGIAAGMISLRLRGGTGKAYEDFLDRWELLSPQLYSGSGNRDIPLVSTYAYDSVELFTRTFVEGEFSTLEEFLVEMRKISFVGITGRVQLDERNSRFGIFDIVNLRLTKEGDEGWVRIGSFYEENFLTRGDAHGVEMKSKPVFHDGSRDIPDVEVRPKIKYWDCDERRFNTNVDGKIKLDAPGPNAKRLASHYECDAFIDCFNISDESSECTSSNYVILFILTGVLTGVLILLACCLIPFVCVFGFCIKRVRVRSGSPPFLLIILISIILGYISIFAWYGQPHPVACAFQPWLLGLSISSLVAALCAKNIRIWRIFRSPLKRKTISDKEVLLTWVLMFAPSVFIVFLWTLISTPTATLKKLDGYHHYVCETGGFTGPPGGFIFFSIFVFYMAILLLAGGIVSFLTRKVPSLFNESRLIAISIYNLVGLSIIIIPVFFVLQNFNPLIGWVIRTIAILYALTATLLLLFGPKVWGMLFDLKKDNTAGAVLQSSGSSPSQTNNSTGTNSLSSHV